MKARVKRRSVIVAGVVGTIGTLVIAASAFAGSRPSTPMSQPRAVTVARFGQTRAAVVAGTSHAIAVLDAATITVVIDATASTFMLDTVAPAPGWAFDARVPDATHATVAFTSASRHVEAALVLDAGVLVVTITETTQGTTSSTSSSTTTAPAPPSTTSTPATTTSTSSSPSTSAAATTPPTTATTVGSNTTVAATTASTVAAVCPNAGAGDDEEEHDDDECADVEPGEQQARATTKRTKPARTKHDDDERESRDD